MHKTIILLTIFLLTSCASSIPANTANICSMFEDKRSWYKAASKSSERWNVPVYVSMAIIQQESAYQSNARPARKKYFGFIPGRRPSSAFGYAQVLDQTWNEYKQDTHNWGARRSRFADAIDFVGWYNNNSYQRNDISRDDANSLYLAYHEGNGGYSRQSYRDKPWLLDISQTVQENSNRYQQQYQRCEADLGRNWFMRLLF